MLEQKQKIKYYFFIKVLYNSNYLLLVVDTLDFIFNLNFVVKVVVLKKKQ